MIRVERDGVARSGKWEWRASVRGQPVEGRSREPLLDACRAIKSMGGDPLLEIALFRPGRAEWDLRTTVGYGASKTVREQDRGRIRLASYQPFRRPLEA